MKKNIDYWEGEVQDTEKVIQSAIELADMIEEKTDNEPGKGKLHAIWKKETNALIDQYNRDFGRIFNQVK